MRDNYKQVHKDMDPCQEFEPETRTPKYLQERFASIL